MTDMKTLKCGFIFMSIFAVYLRSTPETVHSRMLERGRSEEAGVPLEYLKQVFRSDLIKMVHTDFIYSAVVAPFSFSF